MKGIILKATSFIKEKLGLCNTKGCYEKAFGEISIDCINVKRCLCKMHLDLYKELTEKRYIVGIDLAKEEDKVAFRKGAVPINDNERKNNKNEHDKQLDKLYKLLKRVRKVRVKKKLSERISKLKGVV